MALRGQNGPGLNIVDVCPDSFARATRAANSGPMPVVTPPRQQTISISAATPDAAPKDLELEMSRGKVFVMESAGHWPLPAAADGRGEVPAGMDVYGGSDGHDVSAYVRSGVPAPRPWPGTVRSGPQTTVDEVEGLLALVDPAAGGAGRARGWPGRQAGTGPGTGPG